ncbi:hypothetical protein [Aeromonas dhakensis]|uniref:hypothetical protein n=1 Tax=Aeromonas dhakensis TaxID=196024 RepID=UPI003BA21159
MSGLQPALRTLCHHDEETILLAIEALIALVLGDGHEGRLVVEAHIAQPQALGLKDKHAALLQ